MAEYRNITATWISSVKPPASGRDYYRDESIRQLEVCVSHTGKIGFYRYGRVNGKMTRLKIADYPAITVKAAKDLCQELNANIAIGRDVQLTRRKSKGGKSLGEVYDWYLEYHAKPKKLSWKRDVKTWERDLSHWKNIAIDNITRPAIIELVAKVTKAHGPGPGNKVLNLIRILYTTAVTNEWTLRNPAVRIEENYIPPRDRFLLPEEVPVFFEALHTFEERIQDFVLLCIFTGARRSNIMSMRRDEIDLHRQVWTIPHSKSKNRAPMVIPLPVQAVNIIARRIEDNGDSPWIFPSSLSASGHLMDPKEGWTRVRIKAAEKLPALRHIRLHDLRRTLASWQANAGVSLQIIGKGMGHLDQDSTLVYAKLSLDPVRHAMQTATTLIETTANVKKTEIGEK